MYRVELYVILCSDDVYKQETPGTIVRPVIPYEDVSKSKQIQCAAGKYPNFLPFSYQSLGSFKRNFTRS